MKTSKNTLYKCLLKNIVIFIFFLLLSFILRFSSFFKSVIDPDESLYILIARSWLDGYAPYTVIWDNKPPGIYLLFSFALSIFGNSVASIRILACLAIAITSYLLYQLGNSIAKDKKVGLLASILYMTLSLSNGGLAANSEIFFAPFVVLSFYLLLFDKLVLYPHDNLHDKLYLIRLFGIGLSIGCALQIKQVVIFEFIAILAIVAIIFYYQKLETEKFSVSAIALQFVCIVFGFLIPSIVAIAYFWFTDNFQEYIYANFTANIKRISNDYSLNSFAVNFLIQLKTNTILWVSLILTPLYWRASVSHTLTLRRNMIFLLIWLLMTFLGVCAPKSFYSHYFLQLLPPFCLISSLLIINTISSAAGASRINKFILLPLIIIIPLSSNIYPVFNIGFKHLYFNYLKGVQNWGDPPAIISNYLKTRITANDYIYVVDYEPIVYFLTSSKIPSRYVFPPFLRSKDLAAIANVDPIFEMHSIMSKKPIYLVKKDRLKDEIGQDLFLNQLQKYIEAYYSLERTFKDDTERPFEKKDNDFDVEIYKRN